MIQLKMTKTEKKTRAYAHRLLCANY